MPRKETVTERRTGPSEKVVTKVVESGTSSDRTVHTTVDRVKEGVFFDDRQRLSDTKVTTKK